MFLFAHAGHEHEVAPEPHVLTLIGLNLLPLVVIAIILGMLRIFKVKKQIQNFILLVLLLITGVTTFQWAPIASVVSLIAGFGLCLAGLLLSAKK